MHPAPEPSNPKATRRRPPAADRSARLLDWLAKSGARFPALSLHTAPDGERLVRATRDIAPGETVLAVPRRCLITHDAVRASAAGKALRAAGVEIEKGQLPLAAYLIAHERAGRGPFNAYVRALPAAFPGVPLFYDEAQLALLRGTHALRRTQQRWAEIESDHLLLREVPGFEDLDRLTLARARTAVTSRVFGLRMGGTKREALAPLADMMNHSASPGVDWEFDDASGEMRMIAVEPIARGAEVHDSYGEKSNARFLVAYGFTMPDNPDDETSIPLSLAKDQPRYSEKARLLRASGGAEQRLPISLRLSDPSTQKALSFLRIACASESELQQAASTLAAARLVPPLSARNESAAITGLGFVCGRALSRYRETIADDDALLARADLPPRDRLCITVRRDEKRVLARHVELSRALVPLLRLPRAALEREVTARFESDAPIDRALESVVRSLPDPSAARTLTGTLDTPDARTRSTVRPAEGRRAW
ncbi:MAG: SET domain-containing histone-lysine N-methyltransferase [Polyangiaceae bacterium]